MRKWLAVIAGLCAALAAGIATTIPVAALNTFNPTRRPHGS